MLQATYTPNTLASTKPTIKMPAPTSTPELVVVSLVGLYGLFVKERRRLVAS